MFKHCTGMNLTWQASKDMDKFNKHTMYQTLKKHLVHLPNGDVQMRHKVINRSVHAMDYKIQAEEYLVQEEAYDFFGHNPADF